MTRYIAILALVTAALGGCQKEDSKVVDEKKPIPTVYKIDIELMETTRGKVTPLGTFSGLCDTRKEVSFQNCYVSTEFSGFSIYPTRPGEKAHAPDRVHVSTGFEMRGYRSKYFSFKGHFDRHTGKADSPEAQEIIVPYTMVGDSKGMAGIFVHDLYINKNADPDYSGRFFIRTTTVDQ